MSLRLTPETNKTNRFLSIKDGQYRIYHGPRDLLQLVDYIRNNEWKKTEPSSAWLAPNSVL